MKKLFCMLALLAAMSPLSQANAAQPAERAGANLSVPSGTLHQIRDHRDMRHPPRRHLVRCRDGAMRRSAGECRRHGGVRRHR